jgi:hypothetical protein
MGAAAKHLIGLILGAALGALMVAVLWFVLQGIMYLFDVDHVRFRAPIVVFFLPLIGAFYGWKLGPLVLDSGGPIASDLKGLWGGSVAARAFIAGPIAWIVLVLAFIWVFEPNPFYSGLSSLRGDRAALLAKLLIFPPLAVGAIYWVFTQIRGKK